jgi:DNA repair photolyase
MSKAIYKPKGKAGEYAEWACNLYVGCSNNCSYCYCKRGVLAHAMGAPEATLKKCFRDEKDAEDVFYKELVKNLDELQKSSLFFTFSSDPMIPATRRLNWNCIDLAVAHKVRCQILTKNADFIYEPELKKLLMDVTGNYRKHIAFGFTLTGRDDLEPGASTNFERADSMRRLKLMGFRTFASLEPVVDPVSTLSVFYQIEDCCDLFKVGLQSGVSLSCYNRDEVERMTSVIQTKGRHVYLKKSLTDYLGIPAQEPIDVFSL